MSLKSPDHYIRRLNQIPVSVNEILREIRTLDRQVGALQIFIQQKRDQALKNIVSYESRPVSKGKSDIDNELKEINNTYKQMRKLTRKKKQLTEKLYNIVDEPTEELEKDLSHFVVIDLENDNKDHRTRRGKKPLIEEFHLSQPIYCYCKTPSFGLMVKCEGDRCETEWFHMNCTGEKDTEIGDNWHCRDCRKTRDIKKE